ARLLGVDARQLKEKVSLVPGRRFVYLRRQLSPGDAEKILAAAIPGVYMQREYRRFYPAGEVVSHVLGFTNIDD
ncbi:MAG TPA: cell division protein, partial [Spongiibacteraceae bacterium]|nr:cell division protein [Spongiibacteraceae bacterium]